MADHVTPAARTNAARQAAIEALIAKVEQQPEPAPEPPTCVTCRHSTGSVAPRCGGLWCDHGVAWLELIATNARTDMRMSTSRMRSEIGYCGPDAMLHEPGGAMSTFFKATDFAQATRWLAVILYAVFCVWITGRGLGLLWP